MKAKPKAKKSNAHRHVSTMHSRSTLTVSRSRAKPASRNMKPACMKNTRNAVTSTHTVFNGLMMSSPVCTGAHANQALDRGDPDLPVADLSGLRGVDDGVDDLVGLAALADQLDLDLRKEVDGVLRTSIGLGVTALATEALDFGDRHAEHA